MKVLIMTGEPFPNGMAATNRIKCYARALNEGGVDCEVVVFRRTEVHGKKPNNTEGSGTFSGIPFRYVGGTPLRGSNVFIRQLNDRLDRHRAERYIRRHLGKGDVLFLFMGGHVELMLRFMKAAHDSGAYCVRDLCELPYGTRAETEKTIRLRKITIEQQFPRLDGIISISDALLNLARTYTLPSCKHIKVPIMVEYEHFGLDNKPIYGGIPYIFHAGTLDQQKDGMIGIFEAFGKASAKMEMSVNYVLTGSLEESPCAIQLKELIAKYNLADKIQFVGYLYRDKIKEYLKNASLVISNRTKSKQNYYGFSTKVGEYLASGTPLLTTNWGEAVNWLKDGESAYIVEAEDTDALADAIVNVFSKPEESRNVGLTGQKVCKGCFDYRNWSKPLVEFMNQLGQ